MSVEKEIQARSGSKCEFCGAEGDLKVYEVPPYYNAKADQCVLVCETCLEQIENSEQIEGKVNGQQLVLLTKFVKKST
ncbi:MAG: PhnA domain-containing protein [Bacteroidota bacterium]|nr:PhnA domain-containing protein [Bacteroidota bacterium]